MQSKHCMSNAAQYTFQAPCCGLNTSRADTTTAVQDRYLRFRLHRFHNRHCPLQLHKCQGFASGSGGRRPHIPEAGIEPSRAKPTTLLLGHLNNFNPDAAGAEVAGLISCSLQRHRLLMSGLRGAPYPSGRSPIAISQSVRRHPDHPLTARTSHGSSALTDERTDELAVLKDGFDRPTGQHTSWQS